MQGLLYPGSLGFLMLMNSGSMRIWMELLKEADLMSLPKGRQVVGRWIKRMNCHSFTQQPAWN